MMHRIFIGVISFLMAIAGAMIIGMAGLIPTIPPIFAFIGFVAMFAGIAGLFNAVCRD